MADVQNPSSGTSPGDPRKTTTGTRTRSRTGVGIGVAVLVAAGLGALIYLNVIGRVPGSPFGNTDVFTENFEQPSDFAPKDTHIVQADGKLLLNTSSDMDANDTRYYTRPPQENDGPVRFGDFEAPISPPCQLDTFQPNDILLEYNGQPLNGGEITVTVPIFEQARPLHLLTDEQKDEREIYALVEGRDDAGNSFLENPELRFETAGPQIATVARIDDLGPDEEMSNRFYIQPISPGTTELRISGCDVSRTIMLTVEFENFQDVADTGFQSYNFSNYIDTRYLEGWAVSDVITPDYSADEQETDHVELSVSIPDEMIHSEGLYGTLEFMVSNDGGDTWEHPTDPLMAVIGDQIEESLPAYEMSFDFDQPGNKVVYAVRMVQDDNRSRFVDEWNEDNAIVIDQGLGDVDARAIQDVRSNNLSYANARANDELTLALLDASDAIASTTELVFQGEALADEVIEDYQATSIALQDANTTTSDALSNLSVNVGHDEDLPDLVITEDPVVTDLNPGIASTALNISRAAEEITISQAAVSEAISNGGTFEITATTQEALDIASNASNLLAADASILPAEAQILVADSDYTIQAYNDQAPILANQVYTSYQDFNVATYEVSTVYETLETSTPELSVAVQGLQQSIVDFQTASNDLSNVEVDWHVGYSINSLVPAHSIRLNSVRDDLGNSIGNIQYEWAHLIDERLNPVDLTREAVKTTVIDLNEDSSFDFVMALPDRDIDAAAGTVNWIARDQLNNNGVRHLVLDPIIDPPIDMPLDENRHLLSTGVLSLLPAGAVDRINRSGPLTMVTPNEDSNAGLYMLLGSESALGMPQIASVLRLLSNPVTRVGVDELKFNIEVADKDDEPGPKKDPEELTCEEKNDKLVEEGTDRNDLPLCDPTTPDKEIPVTDDPLLIDLRVQDRGYHRMIVGMTFSKANHCKENSGDIAFSWGEEGGELNQTSTVYYLEDNPDGYQCYTVLRGLKGGMPDGHNDGMYENGRGLHNVQVETLDLKSKVYPFETLNRTQDIMRSQCLVYGEMCDDYLDTETLDALLSSSLSRKDGVAFWIDPKKTDETLEPVHPSGVRYAMMTDTRHREFSERFFATIDQENNNVKAGIARAYLPVHDRLPDVKYEDEVVRPCITTNCLVDDSGVNFWYDQIENIDDLDKIDVHGFLYAAFISDEGKQNYLSLSGEGIASINGSARCIPAANYAYLRALRRAADEVGASFLAEQQCNQHADETAELDAMIRFLAQSQEKKDRLDEVVATHQGEADSCEGRVPAVSELYQSCFGRASDIEGVKYWACDQTQLSVHDLNEQFCSEGEK